jgi:hypothetical protein
MGWETTYVDASAGRVVPISVDEALKIVSRDS